ncbi:hypothetical protein MKW94_021792 [Papaver nudicaule]|uniref:DUF659 domain-containing protein n=1 Tax=Papaver nudicaule TaxID=74823 RepID=A0AA41W1X8_PAPNU|nr:hypothetical protein [Papaver nudicaule]
MRDSFPKTKIASLNNSRQGKDEAVVDVHDHGTNEDCMEVPEVVKVQMRNSLPINKKVHQLLKPCTLWKESSNSKGSHEHNSNKVESIHPNLSRKRKHSPAIIEYSGSEQEGEDLQVQHYPEILNKEEADDDSSKQTQRCIGRFFFENGIDFSAANSPSFQKMIHSLVGGGSTAYKVPSSDDLKGWILKGELKAMREQVLEVVCSWESTGCSILLDGWTNVEGRIMINFVVDSPRGPIFIKSADCSDSIGDVDAMVSLLSGVIEEVGVQNVVQIITYTTAGSMRAVGKQMTAKYKSIFWTVCASHCIGLMLEKIGMLSTESRVLSKAKTITKFIYSHETALKLMRKHTGGFDIVSSSRIRSMVPFLILERIESQKKYLRKMFISPEWKDSTLASTANGKMVADLVIGDSFWTEAEMVLKASVPLIRALHLLNGGDSKPQLGYIYETMDQLKETIKEEYEGTKTMYQPLWTVIDGIWDNQLHSSIHSAGYYLNPGLFYFDDFHADPEVAAGLFCCIVRIVDDKREQDLITSQFNEYRKASGAFGDRDTVDQRTKLAPAKWWSLYGGQCPELQRLAIRILSQTCTGALRYGLKRSLTEQLHMKGRNCLEQKRLNELTFVHYNLRLQNLSASKTHYTNVFSEPIDPMDEWVCGSSMEEKAAEQRVRLKICSVVKDCR